MEGQETLKPRRSYHHGDLRRSVLGEARKLLEMHGENGFSVRDAARNAGVSSGAPYRHFRDRETLLAELAVIGFAELLEHLQVGVGADPLHMKAAYKNFAWNNRALYRVMFSFNVEEEGNRQIREGYKKCLERAMDAYRKAGGQSETSLRREVLQELSRWHGEVMYHMTGYTSLV